MLLIQCFVFFQIRKNLKRNWFSSLRARIRDCEISRSISEREKSLTRDEDDESYWYADEEERSFNCKRTSVWKFNTTTTLAIRTRADRDDYVWWDDEHEDDARCSSSWFSLRQRTRTRTKTETGTKRTRKTRTTRTKTSSIEIDLV